MRAFWSTLRTLGVAFSVSLVILATGFLGNLPKATAQDFGASDRATKIKAAYLYNLIRYVKWPDTSMRGDGPFVIAIYGDGAINYYVERIAKTKRAQNRTIELRKCRRPEDAIGAHLLFLPASVPVDLRRSVVSRVARSSTLLVGEDTAFLQEGGMVALLYRDNRIKLTIRLPVVERSGLKPSSKLLSVAEIVK